MTHSTQNSRYLNETKGDLFVDRVVVPAVLGLRFSWGGGLAIAANPERTGSMSIKMRLVTMPSQRQVLGIITFVFTALLLVTTVQHFTGKPGLDDLVLGDLHDSLPAPIVPPLGARPKHKPDPKYLAPPLADPFPLLQTSKPPAIPKWNQPKRKLHKQYDLPVAPPLLIGFTRNWPMLLQAVTSYVTAGWPADQIYVVENTGMQQANTRNQLTLQNPFYLNHTQLQMLGVNIVQTPTLLNFAQLQNFYLSLTYLHKWPYLFWSHMDVLAMSYEDGEPKYNEDGYKTIYEKCLETLKEARTTDEHWGLRFFAYDHLTLVNPAAYEDVGGWDTFLPYYMTDCDMHSRLLMRKWTIKDGMAGHVTDVASYLADLSVLYRVDGVKPEFIDPNPPPLEKGGGSGSRSRIRRGEIDGETIRVSRRGDEKDEALEKFKALREVAGAMDRHKHGDRERNTWQGSQHGGQGEPFYYNAKGFDEAISIMTQTGRQIYKVKWGHRDCNLIEGAKLKFEDQWLVEKDWFSLIQRGGDGEEEE